MTEKKYNEKRLDGSEFKDFPTGHPTKYKDEYCDEIIRLGDEGKTIAQVCAVFRVSRQTLHNWKKQVPEFFEAYEVARILYEAFWTDVMSRQAQGQSTRGQWQATKFILAAQCNWREKTDVVTEISNPDGSLKPTITINTPS